MFPNLQTFPQFIGWQQILATLVPRNILEYLCVYACMSKIRTTIMLDEQVLKDAKHRAVELGTSLSQLIEDALATQPRLHDRNLEAFVEWALNARAKSIDGRPLSREEVHGQR